MNLRKLAKGQECQVRIPGVCNHNSETTVLAHLNGGGMGMKHPDLLGAWACSDCHDVVDGRVHWYEPHIPNSSKPTVLKAYLYEGVIRTQQQLLKMGLQEVIDAWRE